MTSHPYHRPYEGDFAVPHPALTLCPDRRRIVLVLLAVIGLLVGASLGQDLLIYTAAAPDPAAKVWLLDVDVERSVYTWFSSSLILANAALILLVAMERRARGERHLLLHWFLLAAIILALSADEALSLHEWLSGAISRRVDTDGFLHFAWIAPAAILCLLGLLAYLPFIRSFPARPRHHLLAAGAIFVAGAVGMEALAGPVVDGTGTQTLLYRLLTNGEELLEGVGMVLFLNSLLLYREMAGR